MRAVHPSMHYGVFWTDRLYAYTQISHKNWKDTITMVSITRMPVWSTEVSIDQTRCFHKHSCILNRPRWASTSHSRNVAENCTISLRSALQKDVKSRQTEKLPMGKAQWRCKPLKHVLYLILCFCTKPTKGKWCWNVFDLAYRIPLHTEVDLGIYMPRGQLYLRFRRSVYFFPVTFQWMSVPHTVVNKGKLGRVLNFAMTVVWEKKSYRINGSFIIYPNHQ